MAGTTITRIQSGAVDPGIATLERILGAAGFELRLEVRSRGGGGPRLADLVDAWSHRDGKVRLVWPRWRALLDELALRPELVPEAIYFAPPRTGEPVVDTLLAAVAEKLADDAGLARPGWTSAVAVLAEPYIPPVARHVAGRSVPPQLARRGVMIDEQSLWRSRPAPLRSQPRGRGHDQDTVSLGDR